MSATKMIKCIFLSEFHHTQGPIISHQVPEEYISKEMFDSIHNFIITKQELQNRLITLTSFGYKILGCPIYISNDKYKRNAFIFNVCFVVDEDTNTSQYGLVVKKLAGYLTQLEEDTAFLSKSENTDEVSSFFAEVLNGLNSQGSCNINMAKSCTVHLKLAATIHEPIAVEDHDVPVLTVPREIVMKHQWDLTTQQILHYVDGTAHVKKIAQEADIELNLVKADLQNLLHYKMLQLVPIFQLLVCDMQTQTHMLYYEKGINELNYVRKWIIFTILHHDGTLEHLSQDIQLYSNVYTVTRDINKLMEDAHLQQECLKFVAKSERSSPDLRDVFMLYCDFTPGTTVKDLCTRQTNPHSLRVDERKLVQFGVMKGLLRRMHKYPVAIPGEHISARVQPFVRLLDGKHNFDQICCETGMSHQELDEKIDGDEGTVVCWK